MRSNCKLLQGKKNKTHKQVIRTLFSPQFNNTSKPLFYGSLWDSTKQTVTCMCSLHDVDTELSGLPYKLAVDF